MSETPNRESEGQDPEGEELKDLEVGAEERDRVSSEDIVGGMTRRDTQATV